MENKYSINTTQNVNLDFEIAGIGDRLIALLIDYLILGGIGVFIGFATSLVDRQSSWFYMLLVFYGLIVFLFHFILELVFHGQSFGKKYRNIQVIHKSGREASFFNYLIRNIIRPIDTFYGIGVLVIFFNTKSQRIGDIAAGTLVIKLEKKANLQNTAFSDINEEYKPTFDKLNVIRLSVQDIELIKEVINHSNLEMNWKLVQLTAEKIKQKAVINSNEMKNLLFLQTIVTDYNYHIIN
ncbi:MAG: hypothetical protein GQ564_06625 [Bacteroidales bacterium]|nr:hypothetical protein [Bacteroidales bacterium]